MNQRLERELYAAFLHAAEQMGSRVKGMSCFVRNWGAVKPLTGILTPTVDRKVDERAEKAA